MWSYERKIDEVTDEKKAACLRRYAIKDENDNEIATCDDEEIAKLIISIPNFRVALREMIEIYYDENTGKDNVAVVDNAQSLIDNL